MGALIGAIKEEDSTTFSEDFDKFAKRMSVLSDAEAKMVREHGKLHEEIDMLVTSLAAQSTVRLPKGAGAISLVAFCERLQCLLKAPQLSDSTAETPIGSTSWQIAHDLDNFRKLCGAINKVQADGATLDAALSEWIVFSVSDGPDGHKFAAIRSCLSSETFTSGTWTVIATWLNTMAESEVIAKAETMLKKGIDPIVKEFKKVATAFSNALFIDITDQESLKIIQEVKVPELTMAAKAINVLKKLPKHEVFLQEISMFSMWFKFAKGLANHASQEITMSRKQMKISDSLANIMITFRADVKNFEALLQGPEKNKTFAIASKAKESVLSKLRSPTGVRVSGIKMDIQGADAMIAEAKNLISTRW